MSCPLHIVVPAFQPVRPRRLPLSTTTLARCGKDRVDGQAQLERGELEALHRLAVLGQLRLPDH
jgi:hypothetical protein